MSIQIFRLSDGWFLLKLTLEAFRDTKLMTGADIISFFKFAECSSEVSAFVRTARAGGTLTIKRYEGESASPFVSLGCDIVATIKLQLSL